MRALCLMVLFLGFGCGESLAPCGPMDGAVGMDSGAGMDAGVATDAGAATDSSVSDAGPDGGPDAGPLAVAFAALRQVRAVPDEGVTASHQVFGAFVPGLPAGPELEAGETQPPCAPTASSGACRFYTCPPVEPVDGGAPVGPAAGVGTFTIEVEGAELTTVGGGRDQVIYSGAGVVMEPGDEIVFDLDGVVVPSSSHTLTSPAAFRVEVPASAQRDAPLTVGWTSAFSERMRVEVLTPISSMHLVCTVDGGERSVTIAPELLALLPAGNVGVSVSALNFDVFTAGEYRVQLSVAEVGGANVILE